MSFEADDTALDDPGTSAARPRAQHPLVRGDAIDRFVVLGELGAGGMGVVYAAYDPDLDRKVAIKLLRANTAGDARARLLREAQAMAKIDHPNVIRVHEVGTFGDQIYLAMEFAEGGTLRRWLEAATRSVDHIAAVFVQAGRGLAAAHALGLVHRDFKPDNVLIAKDGSVRVTDFGLVAVAGTTAAGMPGDDALVERATPLSQELTRTGAMMGTPAYMAPEQFAGTADARSDQFSFCVSLYEALHGERPFKGASVMELASQVTLGEIDPPARQRDVPARLRRAMRRGLSSDPAARWPSMEALLAELAPAERKRGRTGLVVAVAVVAIAALAIAPLVRGGGDPCAGASDRADGAWNGERRLALARAFDAAKLPGFARANLLLDRWTWTWQAGVVQACRETHVRDQQVDLYDRQVACFDSALATEGATVDSLVRGDRAVLDSAINTLVDLPDLSACADRARLTTRPPAGVGQFARFDVAARLASAVASYFVVGKNDAALAQARPAIDEARAAKDPALLADALVQYGVMQSAAHDVAGAEASWREALASAIEGNNVEAEMGAGTHLVVLLGDDPKRLIAADELVAILEATVRRGGVSAAQRVQLALARGQLAQTRGDPVGSRAAFDRALAIAETELGPDDQATVFALVGAADEARREGRFADAHELGVRSVAATGRVFGFDGWQYANALNTLGVIERYSGRYDDAERAYERALAIRTAVSGPDARETATITSNLGTLASDRGDTASARRWLQRALDITERAWGPGSVEVAEAELNFALVEEPAAARRDDERALAIFERDPDANHQDLYNVLVNLGTLAQDDGRLDDALALERRAMALAEHYQGADHSDVAGPLINIASILLAQGKLDDADAAVTRAIAISDKAYGPDHPETALAIATRGLVLAKRGKLADALTAFHQARVIVEAKLDPDSSTLGELLHHEGETLVQLQRPAEAIPLLERSLAIRTKAGDDRAPETAKVLAAARRAAKR